MVLSFVVVSPKGVYPEVKKDYAKLELANYFVTLLLAGAGENDIKHVEDKLNSSQRIRFGFLTPY